jgi:hypothetical protein
VALAGHVPERLLVSAPASQPKLSFGGAFCVVHVALKSILSEQSTLEELAA